jgi:hypothetical protein
MLPILRLSTWLLLVTTLLAFATACKKSSPAPVDSVGSLDVTFSPANSIRDISLTPQGSSNTVASSSSDATGYLKLGYLTAGNYVVTFNPASGYIAPAPQNITIVANSNLALGTIRVNQTPPLNTLVPNPLKGTSSWMTNIADVYGNLTTTASAATTTGSVGYYNGSPSQLTIKGVYQNGTLTETVQITLPYYNGPGQYPLGNMTGAGLGTYVRAIGSATTYSLSSQFTGNQGNLTVTSHNTTTNTITGTFGFNLYTNTGRANGTITSGTFTVTY